MSKRTIELVAGLIRGRRKQLGTRWRKVTPGTQAIVVLAVLRHDQRLLDMVGGNDVSAYALPLGLGAHGSDGPKPYPVAFHPGEQLLLYTDGVTEARDEHGSFFPLADRAYLLKDADPHSALDALREDVVRHASGPPHDAAAMLLLRCRGHGMGKSALAD